MNKIRILYILVILCIAGNLFLGWQLMRSSGPPQRREPRDVIIEKLHFDDGQIKDYDQLIHQHRTDIHQAETELKLAKNTLYLTLSQDISAQTDSLMNLISATQLRIEDIHYHHFKDIRKLCKPDQMEAFDSLAHELAALFTPKNKPPKEHRR